MPFKPYIPLSVALMFLSSGCYMNKAMVHPWDDEYSPSSQSTYWTPSKSALRTRTTIALEKVIPSDEQPLTLAEILNIALSNNAGTQLTWAQAKEAAARYGQSQSTAVPNISGQFEFFRTRASSFFSGASAGGSATGASAGTSAGTSSEGGASNNGIYVYTFSQWGPQLHLTYNVFDFGKLRATSDAAKEALFFSDFTHNREVQTVLQNVTTNYYNNMYQMQLEQAFEENVLTAKTTLDAAEVGIQSGVKNVSDVLQATTQLLQYEIDLVEQKQNVVVSYATLLSDMGLPASLALTLEKIGSVDPVREDLPSLEELIAVAMQSRPDFLAAGSELRSKEYSLKAAKREVLPEVNYLFDFGKTYYSGGYNDKYDYTNALSLSMPLFRGYYYRNNIKAAQALRDESEARLKQLELNLVGQVTTSRNNVGVAFDALRYSKEYLSAAGLQYDVSLAEYRAGTTDILTVMSAQSALADARARLAKSIQGWFTALADLTYAIGAAAMPPEEIIKELP